MRIAILSDSVTIPTGYRNQASQLAKYLQSKGHEIFYLANAYAGSNIDSLKLEGGEEFNFKIFGHQMQDQYFHMTMSYLLKKYKIDRFIILLDTFMLYPWFLNVDTSPAKTFFWFPTDGGGGLPDDCQKILQKINQPVAMSRFGQKQVKDYYNLNSAFIPHGVNSDSFYPLSDQERLNLKVRFGLKNKFVIGVVARNQPRKNLDRTIKSMRLIADKIPNAVLFLHLDPNDPAQQLFKIQSLVQKYNLENRVFYSGMNAFQGFPQSEMNNVYNAMDVFFLTTSGEGFGVPIIEAMSCGIPVVATDYTTTQELVKDNGSGLGIKLSGVEILDLFALGSKEYDIKSLNGTLTGSWGVERAMCDLEHCARQIIWLYNNPKDSKIMGLNGRNAVLSKYDFKIVGKQWEEILK